MDDPKTETDPKPATLRTASPPKKRRFNVARLVRRVVIGVLAVGGAVLVGLAMMPQPIAVETGRVTRGPLEVSIDESARTRVVDRYSISAPISGNLARMALRPSDTVHAEQTVAYLVPGAPPLLDERTHAEAEARLAQARARRESARFSIERARDALDFATRETARRRGLTVSGALATRELELAELEERSRRGEITSLEFGLRVAEHEVRVAEAGLGRLTGRPPDAGEQVEVRSPVDGVVLRVLQQSATVVQMGVPLLEIGDPAALEIVCDVLTSDAVKIPIGAPVRIDRWGGEGTFRGHVRVVEPSAFTRVSALGVEEQRVAVLIDLDEPRQRWAALGDGYRVEVDIVVWSAESVLRVPAAAVFRRDDTWCAFELTGQTVALRRLELGHRGPDDLEVLSGLPEGATVVVYPSDRVAEGVAVAPRAR